MLRAGIPGRDPKRELHLEWIQLRELARMLTTLVPDPTKLSDALGLVENLDRRLDAHEKDLENLYFPAAAPFLTDEEWAALAEGAPD